MRALRKFTTDYILPEDRIRLRGEISDEATSTLWLPRPLLNLFMPHLIKLLDSDTGKTNLDSDTGRPNKEKIDSRINSVVQKFAQEKAISELKPQPAVQPQSLNDEWLVHTVDITKVGDGIRIVLKADAALNISHVCITFNQDQMRQWLHIVRTQYRQAGWMFEAWPDWLDAPVSLESPPNDIVRH